MKIVSVSRASGLPSGTSSSGQGFVPGKKVKTWKASPQIFPTQLTRETEQLLKEAVEFAVQEYGERSLPELEAEDRVAVAAKSTNRRPRHPKLREVYNRIRHEYEHHQPGTQRGRPWWVCT